MSRAPGRFACWLQQVMDADGRYICGVCDDRFRCHLEGIEHVLRCHPEFAGVTLDPAFGRAPSASPARSLVPAPLWT